jgi:hypothetical protein
MASWRLKIECLLDQWKGWIRPIDIDALSLGNRRTAQHLKTWAGERALICARFYFLTSGNLDQRSQAGLWRYLLHRLLSLRKDLISSVFPHLWMLLQDTKNRVKAAVEWPANLLMAGIQRYLDLCVDPSKVFLLIDGLDELEGDQQAMVEMVKSLMESSPGNIKVCVSSRPWLVFENFFSQTQIMLQDFGNDIRRYTGDHLHGSPESRRILRKEPQSSERLCENNCAQR